MSTLSWLHLTDLHQGIVDQEWLWPNVRAEFYADLQRLVDRTGGWDVVVFTGDITQSGSEAEFAAVSETLRSLWVFFKTLGTEPKLIVVPGNHDLQRPAKT